MRKEYWAATWVKVVFSANALAMLLISVLGLMSKNIYTEWGLTLLGGAVFSLGFAFLVAAISVYRWPVVVVDKEAIIFLNFFRRKKIDDISRCQVIYANQQITLVDEVGKKSVLGSSIIGKSNAEELYEYILRYARPVPQLTFSPL